MRKFELRRTLGGNIAIGDAHHAIDFCRQHNAIDRVNSGELRLYEHNYSPVTRLWHSVRIDRVVKLHNYCIADLLK